MATDGPIGWGIIGCGVIAPFHARAVGVHVVQGALQHVLGQALHPRVERQGHVLTGERRPHHLRRHLGPAVVDLDEARPRRAEQDLLEAGLQARDAHEVVVRVAGVAGRVGLGRVADGLRRQVGGVGALEPFSQVEVGAERHALLHGADELVRDVPREDGAVLRLLGLGGVGLPRLPLHAEQGGQVLPVVDRAAPVEEVVGDAVVGQHRAVSRQQPSAERDDVALLRGVLHRARRELLDHHELQVHEARRQ